jgi:hypothetical protein
MEGETAGIVVIMRDFDLDLRRIQHASLIIYEKREGRDSAER